MNTSFKIIALGIAIATPPLMAETDCLQVSTAVKSEIALSSAEAIAIVTKHIEASPSCSCEIIKSAIQTTHADANLVAMIVEAAILAAPDQMRIISECAIATAPDALAEVQAVLAKLDPNSGDSYSGKSAKYSPKSGKEGAGEQEAASIGNPLNFPGEGPIGPRDGLPGGGIPGDPGPGPKYPPVFFPNDPVVPLPVSPQNPLPPNGP